MVMPPPPSRRLAAARAGKFGDKQYTRLLFRVGSFALLLVGTLALSVYAQGGDFADDEHATGLRGLAQRMSENRRLAACGDGADQCRCPPTAGAVVLMVLGVLYVALPPPLLILPLPTTATTTTTMPPLIPPPATASHSPSPHS